MWKSEIHLDNESLSITSDTGFHFIFLDEEDLVENLVRLASGQTPSTKYGERFNIIEGIITVIDSDPWTNKDFDHGDFICTTEDLSKAIGRYLKQWIQKKTKTF